MSLDETCEEPQFCYHALVQQNLFCQLECKKSQERLLMVPGSAAGSQTPALVSGRRRRSWLALVAASALASAVAVGLVALRDTFVFLRTVSAVGSDGDAAIAQPVGLLSEQRTALKGVISDAKGARDRVSASAKARGVGRLQQKADTSGAFSGGWSIEKMLKNGLDWDGQEGVKSGSDVIMVPPPLVVPKPPMTITINGGQGGGDMEAGKKITSKVRCACLAGCP